MFGRKNPQRNYQSSPPQPKKVGPTYVAPNSEFQGTMHVEGDLLVDGIIHGSVEVRGDVVISETGLVEGAELRARNLVVHGVLKAKVLLDGTLTLSHTARLEGDVSASAFSVETGAFYMGYIETGDVKALPGTRTRPELMGAAEEYYPKEGY
jgi:cytoskeletal protein CcmA (bactofilin family)